MEEPAVAAEDEIGAEKETVAVPAESEAEIVANTMLEPTTTAEIQFYECMEEPAIAAEDEIGAEEETVAVSMAAESGVEAAVQ